MHLLYVRRIDGETEFNPILPNRYGSLEEWPEGFFDQSPLEAEAILRAAARKRRLKDEGGVPASQRSVVIGIFAEYQGQQVNAEFDPSSESVRVLWPPLEGQAFGSPSGAAIAVVRELNPEVSPNRNGWEFWRVSATGEPLRSIRV